MLRTNVSNITSRIHKIIRWSSKLVNILAIDAHPDDIELGCGGLLIKCASQGHS